ncbi:hypothetical protein LCGC14_1107010 [marine sediment metagenome]|uniref:Uncharacterized protein n=1 Tax=marine sediment metagenome TaxID=412755 RepID=A0A0F9MCJ6_9ZZZZ
MIRSLRIRGWIRLRSRLGGILLASLLLVGIGLPVFAAIGNPVYIRVENAAVFRDLLETGDQLFWLRYDVSYATNPSESPSDTYLMAIYDTDGATLLFTRAINYYQHNIISIYLDAGEAVAWEGLYFIRIMGNPGIFDPLIEDVNMDTRVLGEGDYYPFADMAAYLLSEAEMLEADWDITILTAGKKLNSTGAVFFEEAIPGLSNMIPSFFQVSTVYLSTNRTDWNHTYEQELQDKGGEGWNRTINSWADWLGTSSDWMSLGFGSFLGVMGGAAVFAATKQTGWALLFTGMIVGGLTWVGVIAFSVYALLVVMVCMLFGILFLMGRL